MLYENDTLKHIERLQIVIIGDNMETKVVNKYKEPYDVLICRGTIWGNPYSHKDGTKAIYKVETREEAIEKYREWILQQPHLLKKLKKLKGKTLGCVCKPKQCHGDVLLQLIEGENNV